MPQTILYDPSGKLVPVDADQAPQLYAQGYTVPLQDPDGQLRMAPVADAGGLLRQGYRQPAPDFLTQHQAQLDLKEKYSGVGRSLEAGAVGAARSVEDPIRSLLDLGGKAVTGNDTNVPSLISAMLGPEATAELPKEHPISTGVGRFGADAAMLLVPGLGEEKAVQGPLEALGEGGAEELGGTIGEGAGSAEGAEGVTADTPMSEPPNATVPPTPQEAATLGDRAASITSPLAKRIGKMAALNAVQSMGNVVSEDDLGEAPATAGRLLAQGTLGAILGGGTEGLFALGERALPKIVEKAQDLTGGIGDMIDRLKGLGPLAKDAKAAGKEMADGLTEHSAGVDGAIARANAEARPAEAQSLLIDHPLDVAKAGAEGAYNDVLKGLAISQSHLEPEALSKMGGIMGDLRDGLNEARTAGEFRNAMQSARDEMEPLLHFDGPIPEGGEAAEGSLRSLRERFQQTLEDPKVFGKAAERTSAFDSAHADLLSAQDDLSKILNTDVRKASGSKIADVLAEARGSAAKAQAIADGLERVRLASERVLDQVGTSFENAGTAAPDREDLEGLLSRVAKARTEGVEAAAQQAPAGAIPQAAQNMAARAIGHGVAAAAGGAVHAATGGIIPGWVGYAAARAAMGGGRNTAKTLETLSRLADVSGRVGSKITNAVASFIRSGVPQAVATVASTDLLQRQGLSGARDRGLNRSEPEAVLKRVGEVDALVADPEALINLSSKRLARVHAAAPKVAGQMHMGIARGVSFLHQKAPRDPRQASPLNRGKFVPSPTQSLKFQRYHTAVVRPLAALDDLRNGTLSPDTVEALAAVHSTLHSDIKDEVLRQLAQKPDRELTYAQREQLGVLFQDGTGAFSSPSGAMRAQADFNMGNNQAPGGGAPRASRGTQKGLESLTVAQSSALPGQRRQMQAVEG